MDDSRGLSVGKSDRRWPGPGAGGGQKEEEGRERGERERQTRESDEGEACQVPLLHRGEALGENKHPNPGRCRGEAASTEPPLPRALTARDVLSRLPSSLCGLFVYTSNRRDAEEWISHAFAWARRLGCPPRRIIETRCHIAALACVALLGAGDMEPVSLSPIRSRVENREEKNKKLYYFRASWPSEFDDDLMGHEWVAFMDADGEWVTVDAYANSRPMTLRTGGMADTLDACERLLHAPCQSVWADLVGQTESDEYKFALSSSPGGVRPTVEAWGADARCSGDEVVRRLLSMVGTARERTSTPWGSSDDVAFLLSDAEVPSDGVHASLEAIESSVREFTEGAHFLQ